VGKSVTIFFPLLLSFNSDHHLLFPNKFKPRFDTNIGNRSGSSIMVDYTKLTGKQLLEILRERQLPTSKGTKQEYIDRLDHDNLRRGHNILMGRDQNDGELPVVGARRVLAQAPRASHRGLTSVSAPISGNSFDDRAIANYLFHSLVTLPLVVISLKSIAPSIATKLQLQFK
jgi:hypothetical protein